MSTPSLTPVHFLLVDDLEENLLALEALLRRPELVLLRARTGFEALELLLQHEVALALVDVQMPGMDGFELAELMRGTDRTRRVPIIFLTAGTSDSQRRFRGYEAGAVDFLQKPIEPDILRSKTDVFFELYRQRQEVARQRDDLKLATDQITQLLQESQRQSAALREADQRKDEFLAMLAHELRNPLAPIRTAVDLIRFLPVENQELHSACEIVSRQVFHMVRLIDDLLDVARIARGKIELQFEHCDLAQLARRTAEDLRKTLESKGLHIDVETGDQQLIVDGDSVRLAQIIGNLLHNSGKFTPAGGTVTVRSGMNADQNEAWVSVQDTGIGMQSELISKLFEPFYQANQSLDRKLGGLGLGLALAKGMIELHSGSIVASSDGPGHGSMFTLRVPLSKKPHALESVPQQEIGPPNAKIRVLLIEDNRDAARILQSLINLLGHEAQFALDGQTGLEQIRDQHPDIVISDLGLPGDFSGYHVAETVRSDRSLDEVFLVALSGYGQEDDRRKAFEAGFNQFLVKPVDLDTLRSVLESRSNGFSCKTQSQN